MTKNSNKRKLPLPRKPQNQKNAVLSNNEERFKIFIFHFSFFQEREHRRLHQRLREEKAQRKLNNQISESSAYLKEFKLQDKLESEKQKLVQLKKAQEEVTTKQISKTKFKETPKLAELLLTEELPDKLRKLRAPIESAAEERWAHMLRRNVLAPRKSG
jgi:hypothetical protein